jgi:Ni,Fe-hydrogenase III small subunit
MPDWVLRGLLTGVKSSAYPLGGEDAAGVSPGLPRPVARAAAEAEALAERCPTGALLPHSDGVAVDRARCVHCLRCMDAGWEAGYEWAYDAQGEEEAARQLADAFGRSLHVRFVDAGACGACVSEARQLNNPYYNMHRLGFFVTPTPRNADVLMVAGPVSDAMRLPLRKAWEAMPAPKRVVAIGACALSGGVFGPSFAAGGGVAEAIPVDVMVPGCPPPPLAILHALLVVVGRKPPADPA